ncbi:MAG: hypothetical protein R2788_11400 [Saprospiraceae bacterium]
MHIRQTIELPAERLFFFGVNNDDLMFGFEMVAIDDNGIHAIEEWTELKGVPLRDSNRWWDILSVYFIIAVPANSDSLWSAST